MNRKILSIVCLVFALSACQSVEKNTSPDIAIDALKIQDVSWQSQVKRLAFANDDWLQELNDPRLKHYVDIALKNNFNLQASEAQLAAQLKNARINAARLFPSLDFVLRRNKIESQQANSVNNSSANNSNPVTDTSNVTSGSSYTGNFNVSWEIDIWQRLSAQRKASVKNSQATAADFQAARLSLVASVTRAWFNLNSLKLRIDIAEKRLTTIKESLEIVEEQYLNGSQSALNVYLNRTDYASQQANIIDLKNTLQNAIREFRVLLGEYPNLDISFDAKLPTILKSVPAGLPAELIMRRPDVLADLYEWQSSAYDAAAAQRARYPSFSLTASYGVTSQSLSTLDEQSLLLNLLNSITVPIFRGGQLKAQAEAAKFSQDASFKLYLATLLRSFNEVENALSSEISLKDRLAFLDQAASLSESGYELALEQYTTGISSYETVLEARRRWFSAQVEVVNLRNAILQNRIALNLALGGDFTSKSKSGAYSAKTKQTSLTK